MPEPDRIFLIYLALAVGVLALGLIVLGLLRLSGRRLPHAWAACAGWGVMIPLVFGAIYLGRVGTVVFFTVAGVVGFLELAGAAGMGRNRLMVAVVVLGIVAMGVVAVQREFLLVVPVAVMVGILLVPVVRNETKGGLRAMGVGMFGFVCLGWLLGFVSLLAGMREGEHLVLFLLLAVSVNDVAAYTAGKIFGRHGLRSRVSPGKTWEGAMGGLAVSMVVPWGLRFSLAGFGTGELVAAGLIVGIGGTLGDLMVSAVKRELGVKDFSGLIPGHGGVLDRVDSLLVVGPAFYWLVQWGGQS